MASWYLAPSLKRFRDQINTAWPRRDKTSDGSIGDASHAASYSDHNPDAKGCVHAIDIDEDGIHPPTVVAAAIAHSATEYVIYERKIYTRSLGFKAEPYSGSNPHDKHIHVSIRRAKDAESSVFQWLPVPRKAGDVLSGWPDGNIDQNTPDGRNVRLVQAHLNVCGAQLRVDGNFGPATLAKVRAYQRAAGLKVDGIVGDATKKAMSTIRYGKIDL